MKLRTTSGRILISAATALLFILIAIASDLGDMGPEEKLLEDGRWESVEKYGRDDFKFTTGKRDNKKKWHGEVEIVNKRNYITTTKEEAYFEHGQRNGWCTTTYYDYKGDPSFKFEKYYVLGVEVSSKYVRLKATETTSPHDLLYQKYFWFHTALYSRGFDSLYVRGFTDTLMFLLDSIELSLDSTEFTLEDFSDYYGDALDVLEETPRDSIISFNTAHMIFWGLDRIKNNEYRMAVIDRYLLGAETTYEVLLDIYPNYFTRMEGYEVSQTDFEIFSHQMDSIMDTYSPLDIEDPWFTDSVDSRLYRAIDIISESGESEKSAFIDFRELAGARHIYDFINDQLQRKISLAGNAAETEPWDVADLVVSDIFLEFRKADLFRSLVYEAWMTNHGQISLPLLTTDLIGSYTGTGAYIRGIVLEDGGDAVTGRGIVWADSYNPDMSNNVENSGSGTGEFTILLSGMSEGETYYARSFATNSAGTAFGPVVEFKAGSSMGTDDEDRAVSSLLIYPNPASSMARLKITLEESADVSILVHDLKGSLQTMQNEGLLPAGSQTINLDVSLLQENIYFVEVRAGQKKLASGRLVVGR